MGHSNPHSVLGQIGSATVNSDKGWGQVFDPAGVGTAVATGDWEGVVLPHSAPTTSGGSMNDLLAKVDAKNKAENAKVQPPNPGSVNQQSIAGQTADISRQMRASRTLFTGGGGLSDTPSLASNTLLGA